ncbi:MAG: hypothetical protein ABW009_09445 [Acidimicrobiales bacterium]
MLDDATLELDVEEELLDGEELLEELLDGEELLELELLELELDDELELLEELLDELEVPPVQTWLTRSAPLLAPGPAPAESKPVLPSVVAEMA